MVSSLFAGGVVRTKAIVNNLYLFQWLALASRDPFDSITEAWSWRADRISRNALQWIAQRPGEPFALYLHYIDTHTPYRPPPPFATRFTDAAYQGSVGLRFDDVAGARAGRYAPADRARIVALYDGALSFVDAEIGRLLDGLASRGLLDHTLVVVSADHGEEHWDHGSFFHGQSLYDELLHVPLLMRFPDRAYAGRVVREPVRALDIVPTIAEVLGLPAFPEFEGRSLLPLIAHDTSPRGSSSRTPPTSSFPTASRSARHATSSSSPSTPAARSSTTSRTTRARRTTSRPTRRWGKPSAPCATRWRPTASRSARRGSRCAPWRAMGSRTRSTSP